MTSGFSAGAAAIMGIVAAGVEARAGAVAAPAVAVPGVAAVAAGGRGYASVTSLVARPLGPGRNTFWAWTDPAASMATTTIGTTRNRFIENEGRGEWALAEERIAGALPSPVVLSHRAPTPLVIPQERRHRRRECRDLLC